MDAERTAAVELDRSGLAALVERLQAAGYRVVGPTVRHDAIVLAELGSADELPWGWGVETGPGTYRLRERSDGAAFGHSAGPQSWKQLLHPPREQLWSADRADDFRPVEPEHRTARYALLGVRPCDLRSIQILDTVLTGGRHVDTGYAARRLDLFVIAVECTEPGAACFCASMGAGPGATGGYDLAMIELAGGGRPRFIVTVGSAAGERMLAGVPQRPADPPVVADARSAVTAAAGRMGRTMPETDLRQLLIDNRESEHWDDVAQRCLTCGNCTLVCPTCFCTTTEEVTDLTGEHTERWQRWDSCFDLQFTDLHGGSVRSSTQSRYRQWMSHKLSTWHDQFGSSGCVGCGRCIVWCPVGIDITAEAATFHEKAES
ncbi:MAG TPA: 4Fe-4S dicluster domain-containing protein [Jiangellaceae bacterium]|nr:4Fe-4S dicluster domain-containing protein [Jiangellaceae bacterium]